jgi:hypothetical protein
VAGRYEGTIITAAGPLNWKDGQFNPEMNTLVIAGASGLLEGATGTIVLMGGEHTDKRTVTFNINLHSDTGKHSKDY